MEHSKDPMEQGIFAMPNFDEPKLHEDSILRHMALLLTDRFVYKVLPYVKPSDNKPRAQMFVVLIADILQVVAMAMEMAKPGEDSPKDFEECFKISCGRVADILTKLPPEMEEQLKEYMDNLNRACMMTDLLDTIQMFKPEGN